MKEWYLLNSNTKPNVIGGYENQVFNDYKNDAFAESLETDIATTVLLYNCDISESNKIRCIIQGNSADTQLKSTERIGLFEIGTVKAGMYILYENCYWLITGFPSSNGIYEKATMVLCQYNIRWQLSNGDIKERPVNITSVSKYDLGREETKTIILSTNSFTVLVGYDDYAMELEGKRVFIDRNRNNPRKVFLMSRNDDVLYDYNDKIHGSLLSFIADKTEFNADNDNPEVGICDYKNPNPDTETTPSEIVDLSSSIIGGKILKFGRPKTWSVEFTDKNGNEIKNQEFLWNVVSEFNVLQTVIDNKIQLLIDDDSLIGESFLLQIIIDGTVINQIEISISDTF